MEIPIKNPTFIKDANVPPDFYFQVDHPTNEQGDFLIFKQFTYGDITEILLLGVIWLTLLFYVLKRIFTKDKHYTEIISKRGNI